MAGRPEHRHTAPELHPAALDRQMGLEIAAAFGRVAMSFPYAADRRQTPENLRTEKPAIALGPVGILAVARASLRFGDQDALDLRSEERRVGKECVSTCRSRW